MTHSVALVNQPDESAPAAAPLDLPAQHLTERTALIALRSLVRAITCTSVWNRPVCVQRL